MKNIVTAPPSGTATYRYNAEDNIYEAAAQYEFGYKDANATEERLYQLIRAAQDRSLHSPELRRKGTDWPTYYHLTPLRANIVRPFRDRIAGGSVLELGAGCGAITRYLGEQGGKVTALEGSRSRARVIGSRCADLPGVRVYCDLIQNFALEEKFDIVTLIGVLEYAQVYIEAPNPIATMLHHARRFLKPGGLLLVAIENQLGLKYFAGSPEDHLGRPMYGINDSYGKTTPITFGRRELLGHIHRAGFLSSQVYLPFPDYKTPVSVIYPAGHDLDRAPAEWNPGTIAAGSVVHDRQRTPAPAFSQEMAWHVVARNGLIADLANSFLIVASDSEAPILPEHADHLASHYGADRPFELAKETQFLNQQGRVSARTHTNASSETAWNTEQYEAGTVWFDELLRCMNRPNWNVGHLVDWARPWRAALLEQARQNPETKPEAAFAHFPHQLPGKYIDATPTNWIARPDGSHAFIDLEWEVPFALPLEFIAFRGVFLTIHRVTNCCQPAADTPTNIGLLTMQVLRGLDMPIEPQDMDNFLTLFNSFQNVAAGAPDTVLSPLTVAIQKAHLPTRRIYS
ncbi:MAG: class I SAM-dependent methyltransferase [Propionivibrio sp.]